MNLKYISYVAIAVLLGSFSLAGAAKAQSKSSSGVTIAISKTTVDQRKIIIQFVASNDTKARIYLLDAEQEQSQKGFLGSGEQLSQYPIISGIEQYQCPIAYCFRDNQIKDLSRYSYIEPGETLAFGISFNANETVDEKDTISFTVALIERSSVVNGDPSQAGAPKALRFNFPYTPLNHH